MSNKTRAAELKQQGNEFFKKGLFARASELYAKAEKADPADPVYPSNLSAALYETGDYLACVSAVVRAWTLLRAQAEPRRDLAVRLSRRLVKALSFAVRSTPSLARETLEAYDGDIEDLRDYSLTASSASTAAAAVEELDRAWKDWALAKSEVEDSVRKGGDSLSRLSRLPLFMKPLDDAKEYYSIGHDPIIDLTAGWGSGKGGDPLKIDRMSTEKLSKLSFLFGGVGDGRHALGTIAGIHQAYKGLPSAKKSAFRVHFTLLDIHPTAITRDLCMLMLLHELTGTTDRTARAEIKATLMYSFCGAVMPNYCYDRLMAVARDLKERLSASPPSLPSWLHLEANTIPTVLPALEYWLNTVKSTRTMLAHHQYMNASEQFGARAMAVGGTCRGGEFGRELKERAAEQRRKIEEMLRGLTDAQLLQMPWMPPGISGRQARAFVDANMTSLVDSMQQVVSTGKVPTIEEDWYRLTKVFIPPPELRGRHPGFSEAWRKLDKGEDLDKATERKIYAHIEKEWKTNITLHDSNYNNPKYHPNGDGYKTMSGDAFEPVGFVDEFIRRNEVGPKSRIRNDVHMSAWDVFSEFFEEVVAALRGLDGRIMVELIAGGLSEELSKTRFRGDVTRPAEFPRKYTRMWLSNVPDYTHGPMNMAIYVVPNLQDDPQAGVACNCLLNTGSWRNDDEYFYTYSHLLARDAPRYLGCRVIRSEAVMDVLVLGPLSLPRPLSELASRDELTTWLTRVLFNTLVPGRTKPPPENVRLPHNLVAFFGLLMHLHRVGFPTHWLSEFLGRVLSGSMTSEIAPYAGTWPIPLDDLRRRVSPRRVRTDPWLVEFEGIVASAYHAVPFPVAGLLPAGFSRDPEDIQLWEAKVVPMLPSINAWSPFMGFGSPYEPVTRLLFYKPSEAAPGPIIQGLQAVFEGASSPAPGSFFVLTAQELVQYDRRIRFRLSRRRVERMKGENWSMVAYRQDTGQQATRPVPAINWTLAEDSGAA